MNSALVLRASELAVDKLNDIARLNPSIAKNDSCLGAMAF